MKYTGYCDFTIFIYICKTIHGYIVVIPDKFRIHFLFLFCLSITKSYYLVKSHMSKVFLPEFVELALGHLLVCHVLVFIFSIYIFYVDSLWHEYP